MPAPYSSKSLKAATPHNEPPPLDLLELGRGRFSPLEAASIRVVRKTFEPGLTDQAVRFLQRRVGAIWMENVAKNLRHVYGLDRIPPLDRTKSYICVSNHRSILDMYVITSFLVYRDLLPHRIMFPVRSNFFYDRPLGPILNGAISFFAMYPPVFRDARKRDLNDAMLDETARLLKRGGMFVGLHPEGTRSKSDTPYDLLPARYGVGRIIHQSRATVLPVFINGIGNSVPNLIWENARKTGDNINVVFGKPVHFGNMLDQAPKKEVYLRMSQHALAEVAKLGEEERQIRFG